MRHTAWNVEAPCTPRRRSSPRCAAPPARAAPLASVHADVPAHCSKRRQRCAVALRDKRALPHVLCAVWCTLYASRQRARHCLEVPYRMSPQQPNVLQCSGGAARWSAQSTTQRTHIVFEVAAEEADEPFDCVQVRGAAPVHQHRIRAGGWGPGSARFEITVPL